MLGKDRRKEEKSMRTNGFLMGITVILDTSLEDLKVTLGTNLHGIKIYVITKIQHQLDST